MKNGGRPLGSRNKPKFSDNVNMKERAEIVAKCIELAKKGDVIMLKFVAEQIYGKAPQPITGGDKDDKPIAILNYVFRNYGNKKNSGIEKKNKNNSGRNISQQDGVNSPILNTLGAK